MKILTIDTSLNKMFLTISEDGTILASKIVENTKERYHSALLIPTIIELLKKLNLTMQNIEAIGVNVGPGSFTGIRASATVARTIAQNLKIPAVGVPSLEVISLLNTSSKNSVILLDARKGKTYFAVYAPGADIIVEPQAMEYEKAFNYLKNNDVFVVSDKTMTEKLKDEDIQSIMIEEQTYDFGEALAKLTSKHLKDGTNNYEWFNLKPLYIQPPPISMPKISVNI